MTNSPRQSTKVAIIGDSAVAMGVCGLLLTAGYEPALVRPIPSAATSPEGKSSPKNGRVSRPGWNKDVVCYASLQDGVEALGDSDWIFEASWFPIEKKQELFRYIEAVRKPTCFVTTDESVNTARQLASVLGRRFQNHFAVTHFFLPVERLPLVELIFSRSVPEQFRALFEEICREDLKRTVLLAPDTPGFIANRIGMYWAAMCATEAMRLGVPIPSADAALREECKAPRSGAFGLIDLVGLDVFGGILRAISAELDSSDDIHNYQLQNSAQFQRLVHAGRLGCAAGTGFYTYDENGKPVSSLNVYADSYEPLSSAESAFACGTGNKEAIVEFKRAVREKLGRYVQDFCNKNEVAPVVVQSAMRAGYGWKV